MRLLLRHLAPLALAALFAAPGALPPAHAATMVTPEYWRPKDFAFVKKDGVYHLFYIRHNDYLPPWATEIDFGHAVSTDLHTWTQLPPVLGLEPGRWDNLHVWAPHIVEWGGLWWMFYTGVTDLPGSYRDTQRMGVAVSSDLMTWTRVADEPVWANASAPWAWWAPLSARMACRDPFVMPDPAAPGQWLMYYTASPATDTVATLVGVARSAGDPLSWADEKPLWITHHSYTFNTVTESPHLFQHNGRWFLFVTTNAGQPLTFFVSSNPTGEPAEWTYRGRLRNMLGFDTSTWFASEVLRDGNTDLMAFVVDRHISILRIVWGTGDNFTLDEPALFHMVSMEWTRPVTPENQLVGLRLRGVNGGAFQGPLVAWTLAANGSEVQAPLDSLRIPPAPSLSGDSTVVAWFARRWPSTLPATSPMRVRVATEDATASTPWLTVYPNPINPRPPVGPGGTAPDEPVPPIPGDNGDPAPNPPPPSEDSTRVAPSTGAGGSARAPKPRVVGGSPLGSGPTVVFDLAAPDDVRVEMFDLQGRRLSTLADRRFSAGAQVLRWDGRDAAGSRLPRGLYFVRVVTRAGSSTARLWLDR